MSHRRFSLVIIVVVAFCGGLFLGLRIHAKPASAQSPALSQRFLLTAYHWCIPLSNDSNYCSMGDFGFTTDGYYYRYSNAPNTPEFCPTFNIPDSVSGWYTLDDGIPVEIVTGEQQICEARFQIGS